MSAAQKVGQRAFELDVAGVANRLTAGVCEILEISAIRYRDDRKAGVFSSLIKPAQRIIPLSRSL